MTPRETVALTRYVKALCPQQPIDEYTPDAWHDLLGRYDLDEARAATVAVATRQPFVSPAEIIAEVRRIRDRQRTAAERERILEPVRRRKLHDPRPVRETIRAIVASRGRPELAGPAPAKPAAPMPRHEQLRQLEAMGGT